MRLYKVNYIHSEDYFDNEDILNEEEYLFIHLENANHCFERLVEKGKNILQDGTESVCNSYSFGVIKKAQLVKETFYEGLDHPNVETINVTILTIVTYDEFEEAIR